MIEHPFKPIIFNDTKLLILGTFPSLKSFENSFYYAHPKNQFWKILNRVSNYPINNRDQKIWLLKELKVGLWDIIKSCNRENSSDNNLKNITPNNIKELLNSYPSVKAIAFTSKNAQKIFNRYFKDLEIQTYYLPSPSPAYAAMSFEKKVKIYKELFEELL